MHRLARTGGLAALALLIQLVSASAPIAPARGQTATPPNILIIVSDDQRDLDTMQVMPETRERFGAEGTEFTNAYVTTPLCCPSRSSILTGRFAHNHGVKTNGDAALLNHDYTIERYLKDAGYTTGIVGKFLNRWPIESTPPYFDRWAIMQPAYWDTTFNVDGTLQTIEQYSTDFVADQSATLIQDFEANDEQPWFLYVTPFAPHAPYDVEPDYQETDVGEWDGDPAVFEEDESDKPQHVQNASHDLEQAREIRRGQLRLLKSVDELVDKLFLQLEAAGEENTLAIFLSDNGFFWSEHGLSGKNQPYRQAIEVPFFMRWPGMVTDGATDERLVANIDIAPTIMDVAGIAPSQEFPPDGRSLLDPASRRTMLTEGWARKPQDQTPARWAAIGTDRYQYIQSYEDDGVTIAFEEYYDLVADPWQLENLLADGDPSNDPDVGSLRDRMSAARACSGTSCSAILDEA